MRDDENDDADVGLNGQRLFDETDNGAGGGNTVDSRRMNSFVSFVYVAEPSLTSVMLRARNWSSVC